MTKLLSIALLLCVGGLQAVQDLNKNLKDSLGQFIAEGGNALSPEESERAIDYGWGFKGYSYRMGAEFDFLPGREKAYENIMKDVRAYGLGLERCVEESNHSSRKACQIAYFQAFKQRMDQLDFCKELPVGEHRNNCSWFGAALQKSVEKHLGKVVFEVASDWQAISISDVEPNLK